MYLILALLLFSIEASNDIKTTQSLNKYPPCDNKIVFVFETSSKASTFAFQRQLNFLTNYTFEKWNTFDNLAIARDNEGIYNNFGSFKTLLALKEYIKHSAQVDKVCSKDEIFDYLAAALKNSHIVLFFNEFYLSDIRNESAYRLKGLIDKNNQILFVPLSDNFNKNVLKHYYKQANIIEWNVTESETPADWEQQFNDFYGCEDHQTTISTTTEDPTTSYPSCDSKFIIAFDKSSNNYEYKQMQSFLTGYLFKNWTRFDQLSLTSFDVDVYLNVAPFKNVVELTDFINNENQTDNAVDICNFFYIFHRYFYANTEPLVMFLSTIDGIDFGIKPDNGGHTCREDVDSYQIYPPTFVVLNDNLNVDKLRQYVPTAQFIKLNLSNVPNNWEWQFLTAYGCNEDNVEDQTMYPCDSKFIFGFEVSSEITRNVLNAQRDFLKEHVFNKHWNVFNNLELIAYSNNTITKEFGTLKNLNEVHSFIDSTTNLLNSRVSLCSLFKQLTTTFLRGVNVVLFVNEFHNNVNDECTLFIKQLRESINFIHFVSLSKQVNIEYLLLHFPQASFTYLNDKVRDNWNVKSSCGCQDFEVNSTTDYPCLSSADGNAIIFDRSRFLSTFAYQRLINFLITKVFIKQWRWYQDTNIFTYPDESYAIRLMSKTKLNLFVGQSVKSERNPLICPTLNKISDKSSWSNLIFFVSKLDRDVLVVDDTCHHDIGFINQAKHKITFIALTKLVNKTLLMDRFLNSTIIDWDIENEPEFPNWSQLLWEAFGCKHSSPIIFPQATSTTSTAKQTTKASTSTTTSSTSLVSTTQVKTTTSKITTVQTTSSKTTNKQKEKSKELLILTAVFVPLFLIFLIAVIICFCFYRHKQRQQLIDNMVFSNLNKLYSHFNKKSEQDLWEVDIEYVQINFIDKLGSGAFCDVFNGKLLIESPAKEIHNDSRYQRFYNCDVAVKTLPAMMQSNRSAIKEFQQEMELMKTLKFHQNVVCFLGFVNNCENLLILLEYCSNGDLLTFIKVNRQKFIENFESQDTANCKSLLSFAWQISTGLEYLSSLNLIHRDVALRNVLLDNNNICKICDFGLSCLNSPTQTSQAAGRKFPLKWMAIESIKENVFSVKTDVWSYGILLWELFTLGDSPYNDVKSVLSYLESGQRLNKPSYCTDEIYNLMTSCWLVNPSERPNFTEICKLLATKIEAATKIKYNYVDAIDVIEEI